MDSSLEIRVHRDFTRRCTIRIPLTGTKAKLVVKVSFPSLEDVGVQ